MNFGMLIREPGNKQGLIIQKGGSARKGSTRIIIEPTPLIFSRDQIQCVSKRLELALQ